MKKKSIIKIITIITLIMLIIISGNINSYAAYEDELLVKYNTDLTSDKSEFKAYLQGLSKLDLEHLKYIATEASNSISKEQVLPGMEDKHNTDYQKVSKIIQMIEAAQKQYNTSEQPEDELMSYIEEKSLTKIVNWLETYSADDLPDDVKEAWRTRIQEDKNESEKKKKAYIALLDGKSIDEAYDGLTDDGTVSTENKPLKPQTGNRDPEQDQLATYKPNQKTSPDEIISDGTDFLNTGKNNQGSVLISGENVQKASNMLYNVLFTIGIAAALLIGMYLGIKFMLASAEDKASIKESLLPYFAGVIIMFASFSIWKLILVLLQTLDNV